MDADFKQHYQAAERAYDLGDYAEAHTLASALWDQLQAASDEHDPILILGWQSVLSLLLGHIQLHGLQQPEQAAISYERALQRHHRSPGGTGAASLTIRRHRQRSRYDARNQWRHPRSAQGSRSSQATTS